MAKITAINLTMLFKITFPLDIWYSLLFNPVTDVKLQQTNALFSWIWSVRRKWINIDMKDNRALNKKWFILFSSTQRVLSLPQRIDKVIKVNQLS
jgi:hypothetical protein